MSAELNNLLEAEVDIDLRIAELWAVVMESEGSLDLTLAGALLRAAFCQGYLDCYREAVRGSLLKEHGFTLPPRAL